MRVCRRFEGSLKRILNLASAGRLGGRFAYFAFFDRFGPLH